MRTTHKRTPMGLIVLTVAMALVLQPLAAAATAGRSEDSTISGPWGDAWTTIAADGDLMAVGAPELTTPDGAFAGAVFVYRWDGFSWQAEQTLTASDAAAEGLFGQNIDIDGDTLVVSRAPGGAYGGGPGRVYVFDYDGTTWTETQKLDAPAGIEEYFGRSVAVSGDMIVVGVSPADWPHPGGVNAVHAYVFDGSSWVFEWELSGPSGGLFGTSLDLDSIVLAVTDPAYADGAGAVFFYDWLDDVFMEMGSFTGYSDGAGGRDGLNSVVVSSGPIVVGGPCPHCDHGHAYVFTGGPSWTVSTVLETPDHAAFDLFGADVAAQGGTILVGAPGIDGNRGAAFVFEWDGSAWVETSKLVAGAREADDYFGSVAIADSSFVITGYGNDRASVYLPLPGTGVDRLAGGDRYATAAVISEWLFDPGVDVAYVATGMNFPDALAAGPLAARDRAPVLLTAPDALPAATATELTRLQPGSIVILGGPGAVSDVVETALAAYTAGPIRRLAGADRYGTAAAISQEMFTTPPPVAYVTVASNYPDALAGGPIASITGGPILLTETDEIPDATSDELQRLQPESIVVLGGTGVVSAEVASLLGAYTDGTVTRLAGSDRYRTAVALSQSSFGPGPPIVFIATGRDFPDALAGVPAAALQGGPILLTQPDDIPWKVYEELQRLQPESIIVLGGPGVVSARVEARLNWYLAP